MALPSYNLELLSYALTTIAIVFTANFLAYVLCDFVYEAIIGIFRRLI